MGPVSATDRSFAIHSSDERAARKGGGKAGASADEHSADTGRALVPLMQTATPYLSDATTYHPAATFLAHLIATKQNLPQVRERRRAAPREAIAAYLAVARIG